MTIGAQLVIKNKPAEVIAFSSFEGELCGVWIKYLDQKFEAEEPVRVSLDEAYAAYFKRRREIREAG